MQKKIEDNPITIQTIMDLYYENMALITYMSPACQKVLEQYAASRPDEISKIIRDILANKYNLNFILGLLPSERYTAISMMAAYISAVQNGKLEVVESAIRSYNKDAKKLKRAIVDCKLLQSSFEDVARTGTITQISTWFMQGVFGPATLAFFPVEALLWCTNRPITQNTVDKIFYAAYYFLTAYKNVIKNNQTFFDYLLKVAVKEVIPNNSMSARFQQDISYLQRTANENMSFGTPEYEESVRIGGVIGALALAGFVQENQMASVSFTKDKMQELASIIFIYCGFDTDLYKKFNGIAQNRLAKKHCGDHDSDFDAAVNTFKNALYHAVYLAAISELCRRNIIEGLSREFFNPEGEKASKRLLALERELGQAKNKNEALRNQLKHLRTESEESNKQAAAARNKWAGVQNKLDAQQAEIESLRQQLADAESKNSDLKQQLSDLVPENPSDSSLDQNTESESEINYHALLQDIFHTYKVVFVGGNDNIMSKFARRNPEAIIIPHNRIATSDQQVENANVILMKTDSMSHKEYYKYKQIAIRKGIPFSYLDDRSNVELMEQDVFETLDTLGFSKN